MSSLYNQIKMLTLNVEGTMKETLVSLTKEPGYRELATIMLPLFTAQRGGPTEFEHVSVIYEGKPRDMFVDEFGNMDGLRLPVNERATRIYHASTIARVGASIAVNGIIPGAPCIHGMAILFPDTIVWS